MFRNLGEFVQHHRKRPGQRGDEGAPELAAQDVAEEAPAPASPEAGDHIREASPDEDRRRLEDGIADLHAAAVRNDAQRVRLLLSGPDARRVLPSADVILAGDSTCASPALKAAKQGNAAALAALLDGKADPLVRDKSPRFFGDGVWPSEKKPDMYGSELPKDKRDEGCLPGRSVIFWLRINGLLDAVLGQMFPMARVSLVRSIASGIQEHWGEPAIVVAAREGHLDLISLLLTHSAAGLPPLVGSAAGATFYSTACGLASGGMSSNFRACGAGTTNSSGFAIGPGLGGFGGSTLGMGSTGSAWSSPCKSASRERGEALVTACVWKEWRIALVLIGAGVPAQQMSSCKDRLGRTALHVASACGATEVVKALLRAGHPLRGTSLRGRQPLHEACYGGHVGCAEALLDGRADPMAMTEEEGGAGSRNRLPQEGGSASGLTALEVATARGHTAVVQLLVARKAGFPSSRGSAAGGGNLVGLGVAPSLGRRAISLPVLA